MDYLEEIARKGPEKGCKICSDNKLHYHAARVINHSDYPDYWKEFYYELSMENGNYCEAEIIARSNGLGVEKWSRAWEKWVEKLEERDRSLAEAEREAYSNKRREAIRS